MKEGIGASQMFIIVVILIVAFASVMSFTVNHSNAFAIKDKIVTIIEDHEGFDLDSDISGEFKTGDKNILEEITEVLDESSYRQTGTCPESKENYEVMVFSRSGSSISSGKDAAFCIIKIKTGSVKDGSLAGYTYQVKIFYSLDIPFVRQYLNFSVIGETKLLYR